MGFYDLDSMGARVDGFEKFLREHFDLGALQPSGASRCSICSGPLARRTPRCRQAIRQGHADRNAMRRGGVGEGLAHTVQQAGSIPDDLQIQSHAGPRARCSAPAPPRSRSAGRSPGRVAGAMPIVLQS